MNASPALATTQPKLPPKRSDLMPSRDLNRRVAGLPVIPYQLKRPVHVVSVLEHYARAK